MSITKNSFIKWLKVSKHLSNNESSQESLIENFLKVTPKINPEKHISNTDLASDFKLTKKEFMTETLAKLSFKQNKFEEAIRAYEILSLKYPEKISLFADQIKTIKNSLKNYFLPLHRLIQILLLRLHLSDLKIDT